MCTTIIINLVHVYVSDGQMMVGLNSIPNGVCASTDTRPLAKRFSGAEGNRTPYFISLTCKQCAQAARRPL